MKGVQVRRQLLILRLILQSSSGLLIRGFYTKPRPNPWQKRNVVNKTGAHRPICRKVGYKPIKKVAIPMVKREPSNVTPNVAMDANSGMVVPAMLAIMIRFGSINMFSIN